MIIGVILGIILFIAGSIVIIINLLRQKRCSCQTNGVVVDIEVTNSYDRKQKKRRDTFYTPTIKYVVAGNQYKKKSLGSAEKRKIGQEVLVNYNSNNPNDFYAESEIVALIVMGFMIGIIGAIVSTISLLLIL